MIRQLLSCGCGDRLLVSETQAGGLVGCPCGRTVAVPLRSEMHQAAGLPVAVETPLDGIARLVEMGVLPARCCLRCGQPATAVLGAVARGRGWTRSLPVSVCSDCEQLRRDRFKAQGLFGAAMALGAACVASLVSLQAMPAVVFFCLFVALAIAAEMFAGRRQQRLRQILCRVPLYRELLHTKPVPRLELTARREPVPQPTERRQTVYFGTTRDNAAADESEPSSDQMTVVVAPAAVGHDPLFRRPWLQALRDFLLPLASEEHIHARIPGLALSAVTAAVDRLARATFAAADCGADVQIGCVILPERQMRFDVQVCPDRVPIILIRQLLDRLQSLPCPPALGPIAFLARFQMNGGARVEDLSFELPFAGQLPQDDRLSLDERLQQFAGGTAERTLTALELERQLLDFYGRLLEQFPDLSGALAGRGVVWQQQEQWERAVADYSAALAVVPKQAAWHVARGVCLDQLDRPNESLEAYSEAVRLDPNALEAWYRRALLRARLDDHTTALRELNEATRQGIEHPLIFVALGQVHAACGAFDRAVSNYTTAIFQRLDFAPAYLERAKLHFHQGRLEQARSDVEAAIRFNPQPIAEAYHLRAAVHERLGDMRAALTDLTTALEQSPEIAVLWLERGQLHGEMGKLALAVQDFTTALERDPDLTAALGLRGMAHADLGEYEDALHDCTAAIEQGLQSSRVYLARAAAHEAAEEFETAVEDCTAALAIDPALAAAHYRRGVLHLKQERGDAAVDDLTQAIASAPNWAPAYLARGHAQRMVEDTERAREDYDRALQLTPHWPEAHLARAEFLLEQDQIAAALEDLTEAVRQNPELPPAWMLRAQVYLRRGETELAHHDLDMALRLDPELAQAYYLRGRVRLRLGRPNEALADFEELVHRCPHLPVAFTGRGSAWIELGEFEKAQDDYREAIQLDPGSAETILIERLLVEAGVPHRQERFEAAIAKCDEALQLQPECVPALALRAAAHWYAGQFVEAAEDATRCLDVVGESFAALSTRGQVYAEMGEFEDALRDLNQALELGRASESPAALAYALSGRALALAGLGRYTEAERDFQESLRNEPGNAWVYYNQGLAYHALGEPAKAATCFRLALRLNDPALPPRKRNRARVYRPDLLDCDTVAG